MRVALWFDRSHQRMSSLIVMQAEISQAIRLRLSRTSWLLPLMLFCFGLSRSARASGRRKPTRPEPDDAPKPQVTPADAGPAEPPTTADAGFEPANTVRDSGPVNAVAADAGEPDEPAANDSGPQTAAPPTDAGTSVDSMQTDAGATIHVNALDTAQVFAGLRPFLRLVPQR